MDKMKTLRKFAGLALRGLVLTNAVILAGLAPWAVHAQAALQPTQIVVGAPAQSAAGGPLTVQAVLADGQGHPISRAVIYFTTTASFLKDTGTVVLAQAVTNAEGQAVAQFMNDSAGPLALSAEFRGDSQYAPSNAAAQIAVTGQGQVYVEHVGVDLPGFNVPPVLGASKAAVQSTGTGMAGFIQSLWPAMNGWPLAAVLFIVWSMYLFAIRFVFRVARLGAEAGDSTSNEAGALP